MDPANPHPHGKVPTISDDGAIVFESPALALYLTDKFAKNRLGPLVGERDRAPSFVALLLHWRTGACVHFQVHERGGASWHGWLGSRGRSNACDVKSPLPRALHSRRAVQRRGCALRYNVCHVRTEPHVAKATVIDDYVQRIVTRPAFERAQARDNGC